MEEERMERLADEFGRLPEECASHVLSLTSPRDACRSAAVSPALRRAADSDAVWGQFLPPDHRAIASRAVRPLEFSSLKELYFLLCRSVLVDGGTKIFALERESGAKCCTLCARDLGIVLGHDPRHWRWVASPDSRCGDVAELRNVCWLVICGKIDCAELSPDTAYKAYMIFKLSPHAYGLKLPLQTASVRVGARSFQQRVCLHPDEPVGGVPPESRVPRRRNDGWMEVEMGEFFNDGGRGGEVSFSLREVEGMDGKSGLVVMGIQVRPMPKSLKTPEM